MNFKNSIYLVFFLIASFSFISLFEKFSDKNTSMFWFVFALLLAGILTHTVLSIFFTWKKSGKNMQTGQANNNELNDNSNIGDTKSKSRDVAKALKIMNLREGFTEEDLKKRYRELAKKFHPDLNGGRSRAKFEEIVWARGILEKHLQVTLQG